MEKPITFDAHSREEVDDGWGSEASEASAPEAASEAGYVLQRLPNELKEIFRDWLAHHLPLRAGHVMRKL